MGFFPWIFIDVDGDDSEDFILDLRSTGDGSFQWFNLCDSSWSCNPVTGFFTPGSNYIGAKVSYSDLGVSPGDTIGVWTDGYTFLDDDVDLEFTYTMGQGNTITVDGDPSDWTVSPSASDANEGYIPAEYDFTDFYMTDDIAKGYVYHRFDVAGPITTSLPQYFEMDRWFWIYYDTDNDPTTGDDDYGAEYMVFIGTWVDSTGQSYYYGVYYWDGSDWSPLTTWTGSIDVIMGDSTIELGITEADDFLPAAGSIRVIVEASPPAEKTPTSLPTARAKHLKKGLIQPQSQTQPKHQSSSTVDPLPLDENTFQPLQVPGPAVGGELLGLPVLLWTIILAAVPVLWRRLSH
ncbi:MAG: hypothetical protein QI197_06015 [Candidatus Korarchaeota archaeon]|nr:hypothetical protein [Candidatus Korarchaeota archaeon]